jgi:hypothetical protein
MEEFRRSGVAFSCGNRALEEAWAMAAGTLFSSFIEAPGIGAMLIEGADYRGCWLESTGSVCAETLSRFCPGLAESTFDAILSSPRSDGLLPYKITAEGPAYRQVQMASPLARSVWEHARLAGSGRSFLSRAYAAMAAHDAWLARHRDTRGTGGVEAFCAFDTGHDNSPRFWGIPDTCYLEDPARYDPGNPRLPYIAPDMTANVACQRAHLSLIARELGDEAGARRWADLAAASEAALWRECYDKDDECFYDKDATGRHVKVQSDVLLRVLSCDLGDGDFFAFALSRYLLDSRKFFARVPPSSVALDDPRFDADYRRNSWGGPTNALSLLRAPRAFERHGRFVELLFYMEPALEALSKAGRFCQTLDPWTGAPGYGEGYVPAALCFLDFVERSRGILPLPHGGIRLSAAGNETCDYARNALGSRYELSLEGDRAVARRDGSEFISFPRGLAVELDAHGAPLRVIGLTALRVVSDMRYRGARLPLRCAGNETLAFDGAGMRRLIGGSWIAPRA